VGVFHHSGTGLEPQSNLDPVLSVSTAKALAPAQRKQLFTGPEQRANIIRAGGQ